MVILMQNTVNFLNKNYPEKLSEFPPPKEGKFITLEEVVYIKFKK